MKREPSVKTVNDLALTYQDSTQKIQIEKYLAQILELKEEILRLERQLENRTSKEKK